MCILTFWIIINRALTFQSSYLTQKNVKQDLICKSIEIDLALEPLQEKKNRSSDNVVRRTLSIEYFSPVKVFQFPFCKMVSKYYVRLRTELRLIIESFHNVRLVQLY